MANFDFQSLQKAVRINDYYTLKVRKDETINKKPSPFEFYIAVFILRKRSKK